MDLIDTIKDMLITLVYNIRIRRHYWKRRKELFIDQVECQFRKY